MNPAINTYFRLDATRLGLIGDLTVVTELGIYTRRYAQFSLRCWTTPSCEGEGEPYTLDGINTWYVPLPEKVLSITDIESYCIHKFLTKGVITAKPRVRVQRKAQLLHVEGDGGETLALRITDKTLTESYRRATDHHLAAQPVTLQYEASRHGQKAEEVYRDTLSYKGVSPSERANRHDASAARRRAARHFLYKHLGIVMKKEK